METTWPMTKKITHKFVEYIPNNLEENVLYISIEYTTAVHLCFCGCKNKVNTPITPTDWKLTYNGKFVSLDPSVGSWNLKCRSHYWIEDSMVHWSDTWSEDKIKFSQQQDKALKQKYYRNNKETSVNETSFLSTVKKWINWK